VTLTRSFRRAAEFPVIIPVVLLWLGDGDGEDDGDNEVVMPLAAAVNTFLWEEA